ncbi:YhgE/Pip domain-containing protein [Lactococcus insecticola]|uniref:ABC-2 type transporter transmembrane domain-containing protein n=1 Tax=Pseudolactococcus insecticola TaxID=2709158 RepID=A0A6A0B534_9LACT|nr:YhgE/Pip family protein [Lactococcus insecticola]GFH39753.1 hypothetical protein Hs20B_01510 [Lactococcus insecticola]
MLKEAIKQIFHNKFLLTAFALVALLPAIYGVIFIGSMWDPYGKVSHLPVAIVNRDKPTIVGSAKVNLGADLVKNLKVDQALDYHFTSEKKAEAGLKKGEYYMVLEVPADFSAGLPKLLSGETKSLDLGYSLSTGRNYIASKMVTTAVTSIENNLNTSLSTTMLSEIFAQIEASEKLQKEVATGQVSQAAAAALMQKSKAATLPDKAQLAHIISPIQLKKTDIAPVPNNGTAMTPYMLAVSLWTGTIVLTTLYDLRKFKRRANPLEMLASKFLVLMPVTFVQGLGIMLSLRVVWGFVPQNMLLTIVVLFATSLAFLSLISFFKLLFGQLGAIIALVFMFLQLSSSGGTYPIVLTSHFYSLVHPWVPMTYAVDALRHTISLGGVPSHDILTLLLFTLIFGGLSLLIYGKNGDKFVAATLKKSNV